MVFLVLDVDKYSCIISLAKNLSFLQDWGMLKQKGEREL
jgi:hypothetical protein